MLEWTHLHLADEFRFDLGVAKDRREQFAKVRQDDIHLVVNGGIECCQSEAVVAKIAVTEHVDQKRDNQRSQHIVVTASRICKSIPECRYDNTSNVWI